MHELLCTFLVKVFAIARQALLLPDLVLSVVKSGSGKLGP